MKTYFTICLVVLLTVLYYSCKQSDTSLPCDGNGIITFNNKTDSSIKVQVVEAHNTFTLLKNYIRTVTVKGNQSYNIVLEGSNYNKDTILGIHNCETKNYIIVR